MPGTVSGKKAVAPSTSIRTQFRLSYQANGTNAKMADATTQKGALDMLLLPCSRFNGSGVKVRHAEDRGYR